MDENKKDDELMHHGIKGQRWGIRRYQNKDGSLTPLGQKRVAKLETEYEKISGKKFRSGDDDSSKKEADLRSRTNELLSQKQYLQAQRDVLDLQRQINSLTPVKQSAGKKFVSKCGPIVVKTLWNDVGKQQLNKLVGGKLGIENKISESDKLANRAKDAKNKWQAMEYEDKIKQREAENRKKTEREAAERDAYAKVNNYNKSGYTQDSVTGNGGATNSRYSKTYTRTPLLDAPAENVRGTVEGKGKSRYEHKDGPIYDGSYRDFNSSNINRGRGYVNGYLNTPVTYLLEDKRRKR